MSITVEQIESLVKNMADKRLQVEELKRPYSQAAQELEELEQQVAAALREMNKDSYRSEFGTVSRRTEWRYNLPATPEARAEFFNFLKEKGVFENLITINSNTFNSFLKAEKEAIEARDPEAALNHRFPGVDEAKSREVLSFRKK